MYHSAWGSGVSVFRVPAGDEIIISLLISYASLVSGAFLQVIDFKGVLMRDALIPALAAALAFCPALASAATVSAQRGQVYVNAGQGFVRVARPVSAAPGSRILLRDGGIAFVSYGGQCTVRLGGNRLWLIAAKAPCAPGSRIVDLTDVTGYVGSESEGHHGSWQTAIERARPQPRQLGPAPAAAAAPGISSTVFVVGGLVVVAGAGLAIASSGGGSSGKPASP